MVDRPDPNLNRIYNIIQTSLWLISSVILIWFKQIYIGRAIPFLRGYIKFCVYVCIATSIVCFIRDLLDLLIKAGIISFREPGNVYYLRFSFGVPYRLMRVANNCLYFIFGFKMMLIENQLIPELTVKEILMRVRKV